MDDITDSMDEFEQTLGDSERQGSLACIAMGSESQTRLNDWTTKLHDM